MEKYSTPPKKTKKVGDLFGRYINHFKAPQATVEKACVEAILTITGHLILKEQITYTVSTKTVNLRVPSILKTEIKFKYKEILEYLKNTLGEKDTPKLII